MSEWISTLKILGLSVIGDSSTETSEMLSQFQFGHTRTLKFKV